MLPLPPSSEPGTQPLESPSSPQASAPKKARRLPYLPRLPTAPNASLDEWLLSYADMVTLLLIMFVALLLNARFDKPQSDKDNKAPLQIIEKLFRLQVASPYGSEDQNYIITGTQSEQPALAPDQGAALAIVKDEDLERIRQREAALREIRERLKVSQLETFVSADFEGEGIRLKIPNSILFNTGAADLQGRGPYVIRTLAPILAAGRYVVSVEGHTDNVPIKTDRFPSNWELSAQRAATVVRELAETGVGSERLQAVGYGESRPMASNTTEDGRRENRRVSLLLRTQ
jgi:chemotaxis protein MotB